MIKTKQAWEGSRQHWHCAHIPALDKPEGLCRVGVGAADENESFTMSCLWDIWTDMYIYGISPVLTDIQGERTPLWLKQTFFSLDVNASLY